MIERGPLARALVAEGELAMLRERLRQTTLVASVYGRFIDPSRADEVSVALREAGVA